MSSTNDRMGDVRLVEATMKDGRDAVETGPCHSGTKKAGTCRLYIITALLSLLLSIKYRKNIVFLTFSCLFFAYFYYFDHSEVILTHKDTHHYFQYYYLT